MEIQVKEGLHKATREINLVYNVNLMFPVQNFSGCTDTHVYFARLYIPPLQEENLYETLLELGSG